MNGPKQAWPAGRAGGGRRGAQRLLPLYSAVAVGLAGLILYGLTAAPSIVALYDDSLEFQLVCPTFGIAHPTGYPLYTLLCGLWSRVIFPVGNWAWRVNLFSALAGGAALAVIFWVARRLAGGNGWAGLAAAASFGLSPVWWQQTTVAEVYALHILLVASVLGAALAITVQPEPTETRRDRWDPVTVLAVLLGLGLAHHRTVVLLGPGLLLYLLLTRPAILRPRREWLRWGGALVLPLLLYLYIPVRAAMGVRDLNEDYVNTWAGFWRHVLALGYTGFFQDNPLAVARTPGDWLVFYREQLGWLGLALAGLGLLGGLWEGRNRWGWLLVVVTGVVTGLFAGFYRVADAEVFALPAVLCLALAVGRGVALAAHWAGGLTASRRWVPGVKAGALVLLLVWLPLGRGGPVDRSHDWAVHDYAVEMAKVDFPPGSWVVGLRGQITALQYMQAAEGLGRNAIPVARDDEAARRSTVAEGVFQGRPVYLTQELPGIETLYSFSGHGPLVRVWPRGQARPGAPRTPLEMAWMEGRLRVLGYDLDRLAQAGGPTLRLAIYWQATAPLERTLKVSLRALQADGEPALDPKGAPAVVDAFPLRQVYPSWAWLPGEVVRDVHYLPIRGPAATEAARLLVIVYDAETVTEIGRFTVPVP